MLKNFGVKQITTTLGVLDGGTAGAFDTAVKNGRQSGDFMYIMCDGVIQFAPSSTVSLKVSWPLNTPLCLGRGADLTAIYIAANSGTPDLKFFTSDEKL